MKGESTLFPRAPLSPALCDNPVFMPEGPWWPPRCSCPCSPLPLSNYEPVFCARAAFQSPSARALFLCFFFFHFIRHMVYFGCDARDCLESRKQEKKRGGDCGNKRRMGLFFFPVVNVNASAAAEKDILIRSRSRALWLFPTTLLHNGELKRR